MGETTAISWCDHTWNPWIGCTKVSPACDGCYAEAMMDKRYGRVQWGAPGRGTGTRVRTSASVWNDPRRWNRKAEAAGTRPFVFCASLADIFDNAVPAEWRRSAFDVMRNTPRLVYLLLTKRPQLIVRLSEEAGGLPWNAAIGTTVEDQERADRNAPALLVAAAELRPLFTFLSCEPLLGPVDISAHYLNPQGFVDTPKWVITGGETDQGAHKARPTHPDWFRSLRDQCAAAGVSFHHKQNGEWLGGDQIPEDEAIPSGISNDCGISGANDNRRVWRVGKVRAGRLIDGALHDARPGVPSLAPEISIAEGGKDDQ